MGDRMQRVEGKAKEIKGRAKRDAGGRAVARRPRLAEAARSWPARPRTRSAEHAAR